VKPGVCAKEGAPPEDTVRLLLAFIGGRDRDSVMDCFSLELLGVYPEYGAWSQQPYHFFTLGHEGGRWRVYETATAAIGPPP
jgi:hypothetical protein